MGLRKKTESLSFEGGLYLINVPGQGQGVFTNTGYLPEEPVLVFGGDLTPGDKIEDYTHYLQIGPDMYLGPSGSYDDFINHNCEPNCAVYFDGDALVLKSIRHINITEQLTFDYSTILLNEPTSFACKCNSRGCRQHIGSFLTLPPVLREKYLAHGMVPLLTRYRMEDLGFR